MAIIFGYEVWLWGSVALVLLCTTIYSIAACYNKYKVSHKCMESLLYAGVCMHDALVNGDRATVPPIQNVSNYGYRSFQNHY